MYKKVLVLEVHAKAALPILESCKQMKLYVIAGSHKRHCSGMYSKVVDERVIYPSVKDTPDECKTMLLDYLKNNDVEVLIPVGDIMTDLIARYQDEFRKYTKFVLPPYEVFIQGRNKILTLKACERAGCPIPKTWYPQESSINEIAERIIEYPVLIKPAISAGARGITFCYSKEDLIKNYPVVIGEYGESFVQEFIPQTGTQYKVDVVLDYSQNLLAGVVYEKLRYYPPSGGSSVLNKTVHRDDVLENSLKVLKELKWVGLCDFDFIEDPRDRVVKLMEINPRFPESFRATVAGGVDMTKIIYQLAVGENPEPQLEYRDGMYNRFLVGDILWFIKSKDRFWAKPSFFRFFGKDMYYQLIRKNDWGPILGYFVENLEMLYNKKFRKERLRW